MAVTRDSECDLRSDNCPIIGAGNGNASRIQLRAHKRTNHRVTEDTETRHPERKQKERENPEPFCLQQFFLLLSGCLVSVSSVTLWFVLLRHGPPVPRPLTGRCCRGWWRRGCGR